MSILPTNTKTYTGSITPDDWICAHCDEPRAKHYPETPCVFQRETHEFVGMLRIKNEEAWIADVLDAIAPLCARIFVLDDHSTDNTAAICDKYPQVTRWDSPFSGLNEARDKNWLCDQIQAACRPEWVLCVDGDEVLQKDGPRIIRETCKDASCDAFSLRIAFVWNDPQTARVDRIYGDFWRPSLFRPFHPDPHKPDHLKVAGEFRWLTTPFGRTVDGDEPNLHCSSVPQRRLHGHQRCQAYLKHYGYMTREQRVGKLDHYTSIDWKNDAENYYRHMTQADGVKLEELPKTQRLLSSGVLTEKDVQFMLDTPADAYLLHAGPIELAPFGE